jgi:hypothetical protein
MDAIKDLRRLWILILFLGAAIIVMSLVVGCQGPQGPPGPPASPLPASGTLSGKITNNITGNPVIGAAIVTDPVIADKPITTGNEGSYSVELPIGSYKLTINKSGYTSAADSVVLVSGQKVTKDIILKPAKPVAVSAGTAQQADPGSSVTIKASAEPLDGSTIKSFLWAQVSGVPATLSTQDTDTLSVTLNKASAYKDQLLKNLDIQDRYTVQGINPHDLIGAETTTFKVVVTTTSGSYSATVDITARLPYEFTTGLSDVPIGVPVLMNGKTQTSYTWSIAGPAGSKSELDEPASKNPVFIPDMVGKYTLTEKVSGASINVYAGTWAGAITGQDNKGQPLAQVCTTCHNGKVAPDNFSAWSKSGHAGILTQNINDPAGHWTESCAVCHTVGYDKAANNNGFDDAMIAEGWKVPAHGDPANWATMLANYPKTAMLANVQCENCHGPNSGSTLHANGTLDASRISISADVCGSCHGEPPRHGRYQQWEESGHGNYQLAIDESGSANCARCHTGQGFLTWIKQGDLTKQIQGKNGNATADEMKAIVTADTAQPQTCVVCHDPHEQGTTSGEPNTATVRIIDNTLLLPAGFKAEIVGKGAICITCHNTRNGVHNGDAPPANYQAPHTAAQGDVLMGENAYFVPTDSRSPHSYIENTCVTCHLNETPPPAEYSFQLGGTNHAFKASTEICAACHSKTLNAEGLMTNIEGKLSNLGGQMSKYLLSKLPDQVMVKDYTPHDYQGKSYDIKSDSLSISKDNIVSIEPVEPHGQQGFLITLKTGVNVTYKPTGAEHTSLLTQIEVQLGDITTDGKTAVIAPTDPLVKAGWNYFLLHGDGSKGVHNPGFASNVINASLDALK